MPWLTLDHYLTTTWLQGYQEPGNKVGIWTKMLPFLNVALLANLKEPHNQDIKEQIITKNTFKKKTSFT